MKCALPRLALATALAALAPAAQAHPHIFVDVGLAAITDEDGRLTHIEVTWAYDSLFSLLVTEDLGLDPDGDAVLTAEEEATLAGFDMNWVEGYNGDLVATLNGVPLDLSRPLDGTASMKVGRVVTVHRRAVEGAPELAGATLSMKPYDPTYYTAYDVTLGLSVEGMDGCTIDKVEPDLDTQMRNLQDQLAQLGRDQDAIEMGFPEVGEDFATDVRVTCAAS